MAVKASATFTLTHISDVSSVTRYYKAQSSTSAAPSPPATIDASGWTTTEPNYAAGTALYFVDQTIFSDGSFSYSQVSLSCSFTAAIEAWNKADSAAINSAQALTKSLTATELILGTQTAATYAFKGTSSYLLPADLVDGLQIKYWLPYAGNGSNVTLDLTYADGTTSGPIYCYYNGTSRLTTHCPAGSIINFTYRKNIPIAGSGSYTGWWCDANYNTNNYDRTQVLYVATGAIPTYKSGSTWYSMRSYNLVAADANGKYTAIPGRTGSTNASYPDYEFKSFDIRYPILYCSSSYGLNTTTSGCYLNYPCAIVGSSATSYGYSIHGKTLVAQKPVYLKGKLDGTTFTFDSGTSVDIFTQTESTTDDGYYYYYLGRAYDTTHLYLESAHPIYRYFNGGFKTTDQIAVEASESATHYISVDEDAGTITIGDQVDGITSEMELSATAVDFKNAAGTSVTHVGLDGARLGDAASSHFSMNSASLEAFDQDGTRYFVVSKDGIIFSGSKTVATTDDVDDAKDFASDCAATASNATNSVKSELAARIDSVSNAADAASELANTANLRYEEVNAIIAQTADGIMIGKSDSPITMLLTNNKLSFRQGGSEVAYLSDSKLHITNAEVLDDMAIGKFKLDNCSNGHLRVVKA